MISVTVALEKIHRVRKKLNRSFIGTKEKKQIFMNNQKIGKILRKNSCS